MIIYFWQHQNDIIKFSINLLQNLNDFNHLECKYIHVAWTMNNPWMFFLWLYGCSNITSKRLVSYVQISNDCHFSILAFSKHKIENIWLAQTYLKSNFENMITNQLIHFTWFLKLIRIWRKHLILYIFSCYLTANGVYIPVEKIKIRSFQIEHMSCTDF